MLHSRKIAKASEKLAPWELKGEGFVFVLYNKLSFVKWHTFLDHKNEEKPWMGLGAMMIVDYEDSPVGPYQELLYVPSIMSYKGNGRSLKRFTVSKIYVSSQESVDNGINNWGIPKEIAVFDKVEKENYTTISVKNGNDTFAKFEIKTQGISIPISTAIFPLKLAQALDGDLLLTTSKAKGRGKLAKLVTATIDPSFFPTIQKGQILVGIKVEDFSMYFLQPERIKNFFE